MTGSRIPGSATLIFGIPEDRTRQPHIPMPPFPVAVSIAPSSPASRAFVLAALRALRLDTDSG